MAYEGFQLLAYDYDDIGNPRRTLPRAVPPAVVVVMVLYVVVTIGVTSLIGASRVVEQKEISLATAGQEAAGTVGLVVVTVAAVFSTGSAINATLFATSRLARSVAGHGQFPAWFNHTNRQGAPQRAVIGLGAGAGVLAVIGGLSSLVEAASLVFLATFCVVCGIAWLSRVGNRWEPAVGAFAAGAAGAVLFVRVWQKQPVALVALIVIAISAGVGRPALEHHHRRRHDGESSQNGSRGSE